ncbi:MAG: class I SAM-dependent methyltransferase [Gammaproteobacteria bacterium]|nr:class I SAM-dependent methyltransferase [Gammaproteobacteria bacterium]
MSGHYRELLLGGGARRSKHLHKPECPDWHDLTVLDMNSALQPDVVWDLTELPLPFEDNHFDEVHAYEVLEHTGQQGDYRFFFAQFADFWRLLKPQGLLLGTSPALESRWLWGDPGHTRAVTPESFMFLDQQSYVDNVGKSPMSDYRNIYRADFKLVFSQTSGGTFRYILQAVKPSRIDTDRA